MVPVSFTFQLLPISTAAKSYNHSVVDGQPVAFRLAAPRAPLIYNRMVVDAPEIDKVFHALADATRRDIFCRCGDGELSISQLAKDYPMSFAAVQKHVAVMERAGLVTKERRGREQLVRSDLRAISDAREALDGLEAIWRGRIDRMVGLLAGDTEPG